MSPRSSAIVLTAMGLLTAAAPAAAWQSADPVGADTATAGNALQSPPPAVPFVQPLSSRMVRVELPPLASRPGVGTAAADDDLAPQAIDHGDGYYLRLDIHRYGSYAMLPLFVGTYLAGNELLNGSDPPGWVRSAHGLGAGALGVLFGTNTVTGVWNAIESRNDPGAFRRILHSAIMLAADAGFLYTASIAGESEDDHGFDPGRINDNRRHRDWALGSMAVSTAGTLLMWLWKD